MGVDLLDAAPQGSALPGIEFGLDGIDELIHFGVVEAAGVLAAIAIGGGRNFARMQRAARHVLGCADPGEHRHRKVPPRQALAEENARRLVPNADVDAELAPLRLQHLLHGLARAAAGGGGEVERPAGAWCGGADGPPGPAPARRRRACPWPR